MTQKIKKVRDLIVLILDWLMRKLERLKYYVSYKTKSDEV